MHLKVTILNNVKFLFSLYISFTILKYKKIYLFKLSLKKKSNKNDDVYQKLLKYTIAHKIIK